MKYEEPRMEIIVVRGEIYMELGDSVTGTGGNQDHNSRTLMEEDLLK